MKIVLSIEKNGEKKNVSQLDFLKGEEDIDLFLSKVYSSISEFKIERQKCYEIAANESFKRISENVVRAIHFQEILKS